jgi:hypothetical protein
MRFLAPILLAFCFAGAAPAVLIDSGDGSGNTTAPSPDPGWSHVGLRGGLTAVYLEDGWVITANHVSAGDVVLGGATYDLVPGSPVRLQNADLTGADLQMFAISPHPPLAPLAIASSAPSNGASLILIGNGRDRGAATSWDPNGPPPPGPIGGYEWGIGRSLRWGTNFVEDFPSTRVFNTEVFGSVFDAGDSAHEAQAATGDSGGAAFAWSGSEWELAGVMIAVGEFEGQPAETSLYGQLTYAADLSVYRDQILDVIAMPEPAGGLCAGIALVGVLTRLRRRRPGRSGSPRSSRPLSAPVSRDTGSAGAASGIASRAALAARSGAGSKRASQGSCAGGSGPSEAGASCALNQPPVHASRPDASSAARSRSAARVVSGGGAATAASTRWRSK